MDKEVTQERLKKRIFSHRFLNYISIFCSIPGILCSNHHGYSWNSSGIFLKLQNLNKIILEIKYVRKTRRDRHDYYRSAINLSRIYKKITSTGTRTSSFYPLILFPFSPSTSSCAPAFLHTRVIPCKR